MGGLRDAEERILTAALETFLQKDFLPDRSGKAAAARIEAFSRHFITVYGVKERCLI